MKAALNDDNSTLTNTIVESVSGRVDGLQRDGFNAKEHAARGSIQKGHYKLLAIDTGGSLAGIRGGAGDVYQVSICHA